MLADRNAQGRRWLFSGAGPLLRSRHLCGIDVARTYRCYLQLIETRGERLRHRAAWNRSLKIAETSATCMNNMVVLPGPRGLLEGGVL